ncbi:MAG TPA: hypothetical protein H9881_12300 [Candidatus Stackebrandtia excrementipullorum]|nr:hypothetical protein [Candidatus Stackebrandtia excrementipullorum]
MSLKMLRIVLALGAVITVGAIIWIDVATDIWQKYVVIAGLAAGLVTFVLTALVIDRVIARSTHERWAPVTRLALGDLRRQLTVDQFDEGDSVRRLPAVDEEGALDALIEAAAAEREALAVALSRWASFLSASADVSDIMDEIAEIAERLDRIDVTALAVRRAGKGSVVPSGKPMTPLVRELFTEIDAYHRAGDRLLAHISTVLRRYEKPTTLSMIV